MFCSAEDIDRKLARLKSIIAGYGKVAVAFSGGVDSSLLLKAAYDVLGDGVTAYYADSVVQSEEEKKNALRVAREIGVSLTIVSFDLLSFPEFTANSSERCYHCKKRIFSTFLRQAAGNGVTILADGSNLDDLQQIRPGAKAAHELGVKTPLVAAGLCKADIRTLSKALGLSCWNKHSSSCLATRIATDQPITARQLAIIEKAECFLWKKSLYGCRVRLDGTVCTVELSSGDSNKFIDLRLKKDFIILMNSFGIEKVLLDLHERSESG